MQNILLNIAENLEGAELVNAHLSFRGFIQFLKERRSRERTKRVKFLEFVLNYFEERLQGKDIITVEEASGYEDLFQFVFAAIFPVIEDEDKSLWALCTPLKPVILYGTDPFYSMMRDPATGKVRDSQIDKDHKERKRIKLEFIYTFIIQRLYKYAIYFPYDTLIHSMQDPVSGVTRIYQLNIETRFVDIIPLGALPDLDPDSLRLPPQELLAYLMEHLPLSLFRFEGISAISATDITPGYVVEKIKSLILEDTGCDKDGYYREVARCLKTLTGKEHVEFGLLPFMKVNDKPVFSEEMCNYSVMAKAARGCGQAESIYYAMAEKYFCHPQQKFFETITPADEDNYFFLRLLREDGVKSYGLVPVFHNQHLAGVLEVYSREEGELDHEVLMKLEIVIPLLAQLLQRTIDEFESKLKAIIKENFTSIQPAVEWKFYEEAWRYFRKKIEGQRQPAMETIYFKGVYPLYGAVDIRNSTIERNKALQRDLLVQFDILMQTLANLQQEVNLELLEEMVFQTVKWQRRLSQSLTTADEMALNAFLRDDVTYFFDHLKESRPDVASIIEPYFQAIDEVNGDAFENRRDLEKSIQTINQAINRHLEEKIAGLQASYPIYFEKFRTDGVEYDIYVGQSISPDRPFDMLYLNNLRLWQLHSMAVVAHLTHDLIPEMADKLETTQLIFVHSNPIDISFRKDERRFDVEGGYNIRYQVVKKRVDKVHIKGGEERLTQPGKIAVIFFNEKEATEYLGYIRYLQEKGILEEDLEELELEDLQGVTGLRAFRMSARLNVPAQVQ